MYNYMKYAKFQKRTLSGPPFSTFLEYGEL